MTTGNATELGSKLIGLICAALSLQPSDVSPQASFLKDLGADSLDMLNLALVLEQEFGINIPESDYPRLATVGEALAYMAERLASPPSI
jgi:acyl carrier protein